MSIDSLEEHSSYRRRFLQESGFAAVLVELTLGVFIVGYALYLANVLDISEAMTPNVEKWWARLSAREAFKNVSANSVSFRP